MSNSLWPHGLQPARLLCPWNFPGKKNTGAGCRFILQGIFPTHWFNLGLWCLLHWQTGSLSLVPPGKPSKINIYVFIFVMCKNKSGMVLVLTFLSSLSSPLRLWKILRPSSALVLPRHYSILPLCHPSLPCYIPLQSLSWVILSKPLWTSHVLVSKPPRPSFHIASLPAPHLERYVKAS